MTKVVLLRHGQSEWNRDGKFTGWTDVDLSEEGRREAALAGKRLKEAGVVFETVYTSVLKRAIRTTWIALDEMDLMWLPIDHTWRLNERHYGALQGLSKEEMVELHGKDAVHTWRRSYDVRPPPLDRDDPRHPRFDPRYAGLDAGDLPSSESLKDTLARTLPYWRERILPQVLKGRNVLVSAHGNSLRALVKHLDGISDADIPGVNIPTGIPLVYEMDGERVVERRYLASEEELSGAKEKAAGTASK
ncbi:MAG: 2,3-diphosphoglycerate-dependent phosphoglycerate mutase [Methanomassiliicoccus sp.]|nr:2,3-diphosphoglycerate-dependent phosphoglycerate mutase [Methanomassiliicoccus sp.]